MLKPADIADNDPEFLAIREMIPWPVRQLRKITAGEGPCGRSNTYAEIEAGRLIIHYQGRSPFVLRDDFAKWLTVLKRESAGKREALSPVFRNRRLGEKATDGHRQARQTRAARRTTNSEATA